MVSDTRMGERDDQRTAAVSDEPIGHRDRQGAGYPRCKSPHVKGGICIRILVGKQPGGEISETATAQIVMQIPPSEWGALHWVEPQ